MSNAPATVGRQRLIDDTCSGITGRALAIGYRPDFELSDIRDDEAFDNESGALDAPDMLPAGGHHHMNLPWFPAEQIWWRQ